MAKSHEELMTIRKKLEAFNSDPKLFVDVEIDALRKELAALETIEELCEAVGDLNPPIPALMNRRRHPEIFSSVEMIKRT